MRNSLPLIFISIAFQAVSVYLSKRAALQLPSFTILGAVTDLFYVGSLVCMGGQVVSWSLVLRRAPLFSAYLMMSLIYPVILAISFLFFHEKVSIMNIVGAVLVMIGVFSINNSNASKSRVPSE